MAPFVTQVAGCACPRCIAFAAMAGTTAPAAALAPVPVPVPVPPAAVAVPAAPEAAPPHEVWDRTTPPPTAAPVAVDQPATVDQPAVVDEPATTPGAGGFLNGEVQLVPVGTPLADAVVLPGNPFLG